MKQKILTRNFLFFIVNNFVFKYFSRLKNATLTKQTLFANTIFLFSLLLKKTKIINNKFTYKSNLSLSFMYLTFCKMNTSVTKS